MLKNYIKKKQKSSKFQEKKHYCTMHFDNTQVSHYTQPLFLYIKEVTYVPKWLSPIGTKNNW
jgi:hypothetical protein